MTVDMTNNRVPYGLLTDEEKAALHEHEKAGGKIEAWLVVDGWLPSVSVAPRYPDWVYRTVPLPAKTQDVIAWEKLPDRIEWVVRDEDGEVRGSEIKPELVVDYGVWDGPDIRIDDFPGIVQIGTVDWEVSKQRRPR
jgi:hypothetical protein